MNSEFVGLWALIVMPLASTSDEGEGGGGPGGWPGPNSCEKGGAGITPGPEAGAAGALLCPGGSPRMPISVLAISSGSA